MEGMVGCVCGGDDGRMWDEYDGYVECRAGLGHI